MNEITIVTITNRQRTLASLVFGALLAALLAFGGRYRAVLALFLPLSFWFSLSQEPEQREIRPCIRPLGWLFVGFSIVMIIAVIIAAAASE